MFTFFGIFALCLATWVGAAPLPWWLTIALILAGIATDLIRLGQHITPPHSTGPKPAPPSKPSLNADDLLAQVDQDTWLRGGE